MVYLDRHHPSLVDVAQAFQHLLPRPQVILQNQSPRGFHFFLDHLDLMFQRLRHNKCELDEI